MARKAIQERYAHSDDGRFVIDVASRRVQDLFNDFDKTAPYIRKDLDPNLAEYLMECARELSPADFIIRISLAETPSHAPIERLREGVANYFRYRADLEKQDLRRMLRTSAVLFLAGLSVMAVSLWFNRAALAADSVLLNVVAEGLTIAAWVAIWEGFAILLIQLKPHLDDIRLFHRLGTVPIQFQALPVESLGLRAVEDGQTAE